MTAVAFTPSVALCITGSAVSLAASMKCATVPLYTALSCTQEMGVVSQAKPCAEARAFASSAREDSMSAPTDVRTVHGIANGHWEPTERQPFKLFTFEAKGLRQLLRRIVRSSHPDAAQDTSPENRTEPHVAAE
jgi:hypothetical protein